MIIDGPDESDKPRRMGLIAELTMQQESLKSLIRDIKSKPDKGLREAFSLAADVEEDILVAMAVSVFEAIGGAESYQSGPQVDELMKAGELLDHLDTLGFKVVRK